MDDAGGVRCPEHIPRRCLLTATGAPRDSDLEYAATAARQRRPVFVVGCHRSGTNLLYDTLLSAGGFAVYRGYLPIYKTLIPRFGRIDKLENRKKIVRTWMRSKGFRRSGLDAEKLEQDLLAKCSSGGDFLRIVMDRVTGAQGAVRWAVYDPDNVLFMPQIKADIPEALFVHIVRDGRDIALSLKKMGGFRPVPWRKSGSLEATALYWQWMVEKGRQHGQLFPRDYAEIRYEELVLEPRRTLETIGQFLGHDLDVERIRSSQLGRLSESNSSFLEESNNSSVNPVGRWRQRLSQQEISSLEALVGPCLKACGYELSATPNKKPGLRQAMMRFLYPAFLTGKMWLKIGTPAGRWTNLSALELTGSPEFESDV